MPGNSTITLGVTIAGLPSSAGPTPSVVGRRFPRPCTGGSWWRFAAQRRANCRRSQCAGGRPGCESPPRLPHRF